MNRALAIFLWFALAIHGNAHALTPSLFPATYADGSAVDGNPIGTRVPLILIHGASGNPTVWDAFLKFYAADDTLRSITKPYLFSYSSSTADVVSDPSAPRDVDGLGKALGDSMQNFYNLPAASPNFGFTGPVIILGHSVGGLVARSMMEKYVFPDGGRGGDKVIKLITLGTPHHGTPLADAALDPANAALAATLTNDYVGFLQNFTWDNYDTLFLSNALCNNWLSSLNAFQPPTSGDFSHCATSPVQSASPGYYSKIIAYGSSSIPSVYVIKGYNYLHDGLALRFGYANDSLIPLVSALFAGNSAVATRTISGCDHGNLPLNPVYSGIATTCGSAPQPPCVVPPAPLLPICQSNVAWTNKAISDVSSVLNSFPVESAGWYLARAQLGVLRNLYPYDGSLFAALGEDIQFANSNHVLPNLAMVKDVRTYVPAAAATGGYVSFLRVINLATSATPVRVGVIDEATGVAGSSSQLTAALPGGAAITYTAQQVEDALGLSLPAASRPRIRVSANTSIEVQSFLAQPGSAFNEVSAAQAGSFFYTIPSYVPAAAAPSGYQSYIRVINVGQLAAPITVARIDPATGAMGPSATLIASLAPGAAITFTAAQIESALGVTIAANERPGIYISSTGQQPQLEIQSFLTQPGGAFTDISSSQSGVSVDVRTYVPAMAQGYTTSLRIVNGSCSGNNCIGNIGTPVTATFLDDTTGAALASGTIIGLLPWQGAVTLTSGQLEAALGVTIPAVKRLRLHIPSSSCCLTLQSFMLQPGGAFNEMSGAQSGTSIAVRTYIPAADAVSGYTSYLRVINTGATATPVTVALIDGTTGTMGIPAMLITSLPAGAAQTFTSGQVEAALGMPVAKGSRPRIQIGGNGNFLEVQSFLLQPGGAFTEVSGGQ